MPQQPQSQFKPGGSTRGKRSRGATGSWAGSSTLRYRPGEEPRPPVLAEEWPSGPERDEYSEITMRTPATPTDDEEAAFNARIAELAERYPQVGELMSHPQVVTGPEGQEMRMTRGMGPQPLGMLGPGGEMMRPLQPPTPPPLTWNYVWKGGEPLFSPEASAGFGSLNAAPPTETAKAEEALRQKYQAEEMAMGMSGQTNAFFSPLRRAAREIASKGAMKATPELFKMPANKWAERLRATPGVKGAEIEASQLDLFLQQHGSEPVSFGDITQHLDKYGLDALLDVRQRAPKWAGFTVPYPGSHSGAPIAHDVLFQMPGLGARQSAPLNLQARENPRTGLWDLVDVRTPVHQRTLTPGGPAGTGQRKTTTTFRDHVIATGLPSKADAERRALDLTRSVGPFVYGTHYYEPDILGGHLRRDVRTDPATGRQFQRTEESQGDLVQIARKASKHLMEGRVYPEQIEPGWKSIERRLERERTEVLRQGLPQAETDAALQKIDAKGVALRKTLEEQTKEVSPKLTRLRTMTTEADLSRRGFALIQTGGGYPDSRPRWTLLDPFGNLHDIKAAAPVTSDWQTTLREKGTDRPVALKMALDTANDLLGTRYAGNMPTITSDKLRMPQPYTPFDKSDLLLRVKYDLHTAMNEGINEIAFPKGVVHFSRWGSPRVVFRQVPDPVTTPTPGSRAGRGGPVFMMSFESQIPYADKVGLRAPNWGGSHHHPDQINATVDQIWGAGGQPGEFGKYGSFGEYVHPQIVRSLEDVQRLIVPYENQASLQVEPGTARDVWNWMVQSSRNGQTEGVLLPRWEGLHAFYDGMYRKELDQYSQKFFKGAGITHGERMVTGKEMIRPVGAPPTVGEVEQVIMQENNQPTLTGSMSNYYLRVIGQEMRLQNKPFNEVWDRYADYVDPSTMEEIATRLRGGAEKVPLEAAPHHSVVIDPSTMKSPEAAKDPHSILALAPLAPFGAAGSIGAAGREADRRRRAAGRQAGEGRAGEAERRGLFRQNRNMFAPAPGAPPPSAPRLQ